MAVIIAAGAFFGDYLDDLYNTDSKIYTIIFSLSSIFLALYYVLKKIINHNEKKKSNFICHFIGGKFINNRNF